VIAKPRFFFFFLRFSLDPSAFHSPPPSVSHPTIETAGPSPPSWLVVSAAGQSCFRLTVSVMDRIGLTQGQAGLAFRSMPDGFFSFLFPFPVVDFLFSEEIVFFVLGSAVLKENPS